MPIELPIAWIIALNIAGWPVIQFGLAWAFTRMPVTWFNPGVATRVGTGRTFLRTHLRHQDAGKTGCPTPRAGSAAALPRARWPDSHPDYLRRFIRETWRGELCHWVALGCAPVFFLWNPWWADLIMVGYGLLANLPCILAQRYNRLRLQRLLSRRSASGS